MIDGKRYRGEGGKEVAAGWVLSAVLAILLLLPVIRPVAAAAQSTPPTGGTSQELPEAPRPQYNAPPVAVTPPAAASETPADNAPAPVPPAPNPSSAPPGPPPKNPITTATPGSLPDVPSSPRDQLFTLSHSVNFVLVPVTVKTGNGQLVEGLTPNDFSVYEDGVRQNITFFTSDPFPLSAAIVLDRGLSDNTWKNIRDTLPALVGAFSQFDEVSLFTYSNTVRKVQNLAGADAEVLAASVHKLKYENEAGTGYGAAVALGPLSPAATPSVAGPPSNPPPPIVAMPNESYVLNDAILAAADELSQRGPTRRKIVFVVSDGREFGSTNKYEEVLRVLLSQQITLYAVGVGDAGIPVYRRLRKVHIPGRGYEDILPKYVSATGGQVFSELTQRDIEQAYARVTGEARNQYSIGYNTAVRPTAGYHSIEVRVHRPSLKVYAKDGYYPLPPTK